MYFEVSGVSKRQLDRKIQAGFGINISYPEQHVFSSTRKCGVHSILRGGMGDEKCKSWLLNDWRN